MNIEKKGYYLDIEGKGYLNIKGKISYEYKGKGYYLSIERKDTI